MARPDEVVEWGYNLQVFSGRFIGGKSNLFPLITDYTSNYLPPRSLPASRSRT